MRCGGTACATESRAADWLVSVDIGFLRINADGARSLPDQRASRRRQVTKARNPRTSPPRSLRTSGNVSAYRQQGRRQFLVPHRLGGIADKAAAWRQAFRSWTVTSSIFRSLSKRLISDVLISDSIRD